MSSNSSASETETTPLRRPDYQQNVDVVHIKPINSFIATTATSLTNTNNQNDLINLATTTVVITNNHNNHNNNNNSNNNSVEVRLNNNNNNNNNNSNHHHHHQQQQQQYLHNNSIISKNSANRRSNDNNTGNFSEQFLTMETNKRILYRVGLDAIILMCVGLPILLFFIWGDPYKRGFFCDDESLMHPFKDSTIKSWMLYVIGLLIPIGVMLLVEILQSRHNERISNGNSTSRRYVFMDYEIPDWMLEAYKKIGIFGFGVLVTQLTTDIAKYSIGRLRPHFFAVCQPIMPDGTTCASFLNQHKYIMDFHCKGLGSTERMLKEARLSFPSGHSSFSFFTMVYLAMYLQSRMTWQGSKLLRHFLQFCFIMVAWYTALSRVSDYKHHWSDVLAGTVIGSLLAIVVPYLMPDNCFKLDTVWPNKIQEQDKDE
ncbi:wunen isoform 2-T3 [Glossina fuscipes fuscipes]